MKGQLLLALVLVALAFGQYCCPDDTWTLLTNQASTTETRVIRVEAWIDGSDELIIQGGTVQWYHMTYEPVGRWSRTCTQETLPCGEPTKIQLNGGVQVQWKPSWPTDPAVSSSPAFSSTYYAEELYIPFAPSVVTITQYSYRTSGAISITQQPQASNGFTFKAKFDDNPPGGAAWYTVEFTVVSTVPPPPRGCYRLVNDMLTWNAAQANCATGGSNLISIHNQGEENLLHTMCTTCHIGLNDKTTEGTYGWSDATAMDYTAWSGSARTPAQLADQDCVFASASYEGKYGWHQEVCGTTTWPSVCEMLTCQSGYYPTASNTCMACPEGQWREGCGVGTCTTCPEGYTCKNGIKRMPLALTSESPFLRTVDVGVANPQLYKMLAVSQDIVSFSWKVQPACTLGTGTSPFTLDANGVVSIAAVPDLLGCTVWRLSLTATDGVSTVETTGVVRIVKGNAPPVFPEQPLTRTINEHSPIGTELPPPLIGTDVDSDNIFIYSIKSGDNDQFFGVDASSGMISAARNDLDYDTNPSFTLTMEAKDFGTGMYDTIHNVQVLGTDAIWLSGREDVIIPPTNADAYWTTATRAAWSQFLPRHFVNSWTSVETRPKMIPVSGGDIVTILSATGTVTHSWPSGTAVPPEGLGNNADIGPAGGISGYKGKGGTLAGLFLDDNVPSANPPTNLVNYQVDANRNQLVLQPSLRHVFFIGDGKAVKTGGTMEIQQFIAPVNATRFFVGIIDAPNWVGTKPGTFDDNNGAFQVQVKVNHIAKDNPKASTLAIDVTVIDVMVDCGAHGMRLDDTTCQCWDPTIWGDKECRTECVPNCNYRGTCKCVEYDVYGACVKSTKDMCDCFDPVHWMGAHCDVLKCGHGHTVADPTAEYGQKCVCDARWGGPSCDVQVNCVHGWEMQNENGEYVCTCLSGWQGPFCDVPTWGDDVKCNHGLWVSGQCRCIYGWNGEWCDEVPTTTSPKCYYGWWNEVTGTCVCMAGWSGTSCVQKLGGAVRPDGGRDIGIPQKACLWGTYNPNSNTCDCMENYIGDICEEYVMPTYPSCLDGKFYDPLQKECVLPPSPPVIGCYHGTKNEQDVCECDAGWKDVNCGTYKCLNGVWDATLDGGNGACVCLAGYVGEKCDTRATDFECNAPEFGVVKQDKTCGCKFGVSGDKCQFGEPSSGEGFVDCLWGVFLNDMTCYCIHGYTLDTTTGVCSVEPQVTPPQHLCVWGRPKTDGTCECSTGYTGTICADEVPRSVCFKGWWQNNECKCADGWTGEKCDKQVKFPKMCTYEEGAVAPCVNDAENDCGYGAWNAETEKCDCVVPFTGEQCNTLLPNSDDSSSQGYKPFSCEHGLEEELIIDDATVKFCDCLIGWRGDACDMPICLNDGLIQYTNSESFPVAPAVFDTQHRAIGGLGVTFKLTPKLRDEFCTVQMEVGYHMPNGRANGMDYEEAATLKIVRAPCADESCAEVEGPVFQVMNQYVAYIRFPADDRVGTKYTIYRRIDGTWEEGKTVETAAYEECEPNAAMSGEISCKCTEGFYGKYCQFNCMEECNNHGTACPAEGEVGVCTCAEHYTGADCEFFEMENEMQTANGLTWRAEGKVQVSTVKCPDSNARCVPAVVKAVQGPSKVALLSAPKPPTGKRYAVKLYREPESSLRRLAGDCELTAKYDAASFELEVQMCEDGTYTFELEDVPHDDSSLPHHTGGAISTGVSVILGLLMLWAAIIVA